MKKTVMVFAFLILFQMSVTGAFNPNITSISNNDLSIESSSYHEINYVIITSPYLEDAIVDFKIWKEYPGFSVEIFNTSWISKQYNGRDLQEQIRTFLIDKYEEWNIQYVLIVGSRNTIPMRRCDPIIWDFGEYYYCDYYYSDITGNWDYDGDGKYAEYDEDIVDFTPEISVGRIPSDDTNTVAQILENIMEFGSDDGSWKKNVLMLAAISYYQGLESYGWVYDRSDCATIMEECKNDFFDPKGYSCVRMYEAEGLRPSTYDHDYPLEQTNAIAEWTNNYGLVNMIGHSNENLASRWIWTHDDGDNIPEVGIGELIYKDILTKSDSSLLSIDKPPIVFSGGCSQLHGPNNMGRSFIENNAAVAYIGTTDLGFYNITRVWNDESDGGFGSIDYYFFYYLVNHNQTCGDALSNAKLYFSNHFMFNEYNPEWIYRSYSTLMATTLYGDPSLPLLPLSNPPEKPDTPDGVISGKTNKNYTFTTSCIEPDNDQVRYLFDWGDGNISKSEYLNSKESVSLSYCWQKEGTFDIRVRSQDEHGIWSDWSNPLKVSMPKTKEFNLLQFWLFKLIDRFLLISSLLIDEFQYS